MDARPQKSSYLQTPGASSPHRARHGAGLSVPRRTIGCMFPFVGTEAIAAGEFTRDALRWNHTAIHPNVYLPNGAHRTVSTSRSN